MTGEVDNDVVLRSCRGEFVSDRVAYLLDGAFDARKVIAAAKLAATDGTVDGSPSMRSIAKVAPFLTADERAALGVTDPPRPGMVIRAAWRDGALGASP